MPHAEITSANSGAAPAPDRYVRPHERKKGPWDEYELEDAGRTMEDAKKIEGNPAFVEAVAAHHEKKAKRHKKIAGEMRGAMKRGLVSEKALEKASGKHA